MTAPASSPMAPPEGLFESFRSVFGSPRDPSALRLFFAPGRVNLIGEHTDYNGGHVLPCGLAMGTWLLAAPRSGGQCRIFSANVPEAGIVEFPLAAPWDPADPKWSRYPRAVLAVLREKGAGPAMGLDALYHGTIPSGAGLSSSASIEVVTGFAFARASGLPVDLVELALCAQKAENEKVGVKCGIMDQFAASLSIEGKAILLNCRTLERRHCRLELPGARLIVANSNKPHQLSDSGYNERFEQCRKALAALRERHEADFLCGYGLADLEGSADLLEDGLLYRRARHVISENQRTLAAAELLEAGDLEGFGRLMAESHASMRDDFEISCPEMDILVDLALAQEGVYGSRMTGGGFGGCSVSVVSSDAAEDFMAKVGEGYKAKVGYAPTFYLPETSGGVREIDRGRL